MRARVLLACCLTAAACGGDKKAALVVNVNQEPVAILDGPRQAPARLAFQVDGSRSYDVDGRIVSSRILFNDDTQPVPAAQATHTYARPGLYTVELEVTDDAGRKSRARYRLEVTAPPDSNAPTLSGLSMTSNSVSIHEGDTLPSGRTLGLAVTASDAEGNLSDVVLAASGSLGTVPVTPAATRAVTGSSAEVTFSLVVPEAAGQLNLSLQAHDAFGNASVPQGATFTVLLATADSDGDGLPDGTDPAPSQFNGMRAQVYRLTDFPRDLLNRPRAEKVNEALRAATPVFVGNVAQGFLHVSTSSSGVNTLPGLSGGPSDSTMFAVLFKGQLVIPAGATAFTVTTTADDIAVVFANSTPVASSDRSFARDFFRLDLVPSTSERVSLAPGGTQVEILFANGQGVYAMDVAWTFLGSDGGVVLAPAQVGQAQFLTPP